MKPEILKILQERYFLKNEKTWEDLAKRISKLYPDIYEDIVNMNFLPSSPTLMNAFANGERKGTLSSCFILDVEDDMSSIMDTMKDIALVTKSCGGSGINWSKLRSKKEYVNGIGRNSGGVLSFIGIFDSVLDGVRQGNRRGAGMSMLEISHGDILDFIQAKQNQDALNRSNFSVKINDAFYKTLEKDPNKEYYTIDVTTGKRRELKDNNGNTITYKKLWEIIIESAWKCAEPGIFNGDIAADRCTCKHISRNIGGNPCAEYTHLPLTSCNLGSLNLVKFVRKDKTFDWDKFEKIIEKSTLFLNSVIDHNEFPLEKIKQETLKARPIGLGTMGYAHMLFKMGIPFNSKEAHDLTEKIYYYCTLRSMKTSVELAKQKNKTYKYFDYETFMDANKRFWKYDKVQNLDVKELMKDIKKYGCYNSSQTSIAPSGTISFIADTSSGIEPVFGLVYSRKIEVGNKEYRTEYIVDPVFDEYIKEKYFEKIKQIYEYVSTHNGSCRGCDILTKEEQSIFVTAGDLTPMEHLDSLAIVANNISLSVSKTINMPTESTVKEISEVYLAAHKKGIIGATIFRNGSRDGILNHQKVERRDIVERPDDLPCDIWETTVDGKRHIALVGLMNGTLFEMFVTEDDKCKIDFEKNKNGIIRKVKSDHYDLIINGEKIIENIGELFDKKDLGLSRVTSLLLQTGAPLTKIVKSYEKSPNFFGPKRAVARILKKYIKDGEKAHGEQCPECNTTLQYKDGCKSCPTCGWSKCS